MFDKTNQRVIGLEGETVHQFKQVGLCIICDKPVMDYDDVGEYGQHKFHDFCFINQILMPHISRMQRKTKEDLQQ